MVVVLFSFGNSNTFSYLYRKKVNCSDMTVVNFKPEEDSVQDMEKNALDIEGSMTSQENEQLLGRVLAGKRKRIKRQNSNSACLVYLYSSRVYVRTYLHLDDTKIMFLP